MEFECTEEEFRIFENLVEDEELIGSFPFYLELVLLGVKPGTCPAHKDEIEMFREEFEEMGLHVKRVELDFVDLEELPEYMKEQEYNRPYFVARDRGRLNMLKDRYSENEEKQYDRDFALFLGYPEDDVEWFIEKTEDIGGAVERSKEGLDDPDDFDYVTSIVMYIPKPTEEAYQRAKETAEEYIQALNEAESQFDSKVGDKLIKAQCNR